MQTVPAINIAHTAATATAILNPGKRRYHFLDSWQKVGPEEAQKCAKRYLTAMPAWAHKADE